MAKTKRQKISISGNLISVIQYTPPMPRDGQPVRAEKMRVSSKARQRINDRTAWRWLEQLLYCNFGPGDLFLTLTYRDADFPADRAGARRCLKKFFAGLRQLRRDQGGDLLYIYNIEHRHKGGICAADICGAHEEGRLHHHLILNGVGDDLAQIKSLWSYGDQIDLQILPNNVRFEDYAKYLTKEAREDGRGKVGQRSYTSALGLKKPDIENVWVDSFSQIAAPAGAVVLEREGVGTEYGEFAYLKYLIPQPEPRPLARPSRGKSFSLRA